MKIAIGADHHGFALKDFLQKWISHVGEHSIEWVDYGTYSTDRCDYPGFAYAVARAVQKHECDLGILICGTGAGMAIAANRLRGIYAAVVWDRDVARAVREDDNVNVLVLPADYIDFCSARWFVKAWLNGTFKEDRYRKRLEMLEELSR